MSYHKRAKRKGGRPFVMIEKDMLNSKEWKELSHTTKLMYIKLKSKYNGRNNGSIDFKYSEADDEFAPATISRALAELTEKGWIEKTQHGGMFRYYCLYALTGRYDNIR